MGGLGVGVGVSSSSEPGKSRGEGIASAAMPRPQSPAAAPTEGVCAGGVLSASRLGTGGGTCDIKHHTAVSNLARRCDKNVTPRHTVTSPTSGVTRTQRRRHKPHLAARHNHNTITSPGVTEASDMTLHNSNIVLTDRISRCDRNISITSPGVTVPGDVTLHNSNIVLTDRTSQCDTNITTQLRSDAPLQWRAPCRRHHGLSPAEWSR
eukprot:1185174-Prorocentrum_minimum.AAC.4